MHVISVSEKIVPAKTCSCSFYPVLYTPWVYSNTNRNVISINTLKDTPMELDALSISTRRFHCNDVMHVSSVSEKIVLAKTCSCSFYLVSYTHWMYSNTNGNVFSINTLKDTPMELDALSISTGRFHCNDVMHVSSVSEKILLAKTCSCSFYLVSYTPWVYSNTNRNVISINTLKDTPMELDAHSISTGRFHCNDVMHVSSVSEKIVLAKTCFCSFYPVSCTPWVYSSTNPGCV